VTAWGMLEGVMQGEDYVVGAESGYGREMLEKACSKGGLWRGYVGWTCWWCDLIGRWMWGGGEGRDKRKILIKCAFI